MKTWKDLKVGDTVWMEGDRYSRNRGQGDEQIVKTIGRKYITTWKNEGWREYKFDKETMAEVVQYGAGGRLILDLQDWHDENKAQEIRKLVSQKVLHGKPSLETMKKIAELLDISF